MSLPHFKNFRKVQVVHHAPAGRITLLKESKKIALAIGEKAITVHHIGSKAIRSIYAEPIIDLLIEVKDFAKVES
ncbi:GrpB family protein [Microcoleus sp. Pol12B5]|uniref:GrpB family protein n=1 Tax=unclassified Microcoleus TaxID=2642155 RepID=UPI002FD13EC0